MITILRIGHRPFRDKRITTHCALVARAFLADEILIDTKDEKIEQNLEKIRQKFGGKFKIKTGINWKKAIREHKGIKIHLTMYGMKIDEAIEEIKDKKDDLLIIIGAEKVPPIVYEKADYNISVGNQPHSEVAALAIILDRITKQKWIDKKYDAEIQIHPSNKGKIVGAR